MEDPGSVARPNTTYHLELSDEEQWVVHHLMLDRLGFGPQDDDPPDAFVCTLAVVEKIERGRTGFSQLELDQIRLACQRYIETASIPDNERARAKRIIDRIDESPSAVKTTPH